MTSSASTRQPAASSSVSVSTRRAEAYTVNSPRASRSAVARPMPVEHPVISTFMVRVTLPVR